MLLFSPLAWPPCFFQHVGREFGFGPRLLSSSPHVGTIPRSLLFWALTWSLCSDAGPYRKVSESGRCPGVGWDLTDPGWALPGPASSSGLLGSRCASLTTQAHFQTFTLSKSANNPQTNQRLKSRDGEEHSTHQDAMTKVSVPGEWRVATNNSVLHM